MEGFKPPVENISTTTRKYSTTVEIILELCAITILFVYLSTYYGIESPQVITLSKSLDKEGTPEPAQDCYVVRPVSDELGRNYIDMEVKSLPEIEKKLSHRNKSRISFGGEFIPESTSTLVKGDRHMHEECTIIDNSKYKMAIIVPFRDRPDHLRIFLNNMHPYLMRQKLHYKIFLIEPHSSLTFNRGLLKNIGYVEAMKDSSKWNCFMFHDIDYMPENANTLYECNDDYPFHFSSALNTASYVVDGYFKRYFGGVLAFTKEQFAKVNGYSNLFYEWGSEDDDLYIRSVIAFTKVKKQTRSIGKYTMLKHKKYKVLTIRKKIEDDYSRHFDPKKREGLNTLSKLYDVKVIEQHVLFTKYIVTYPNSSDVLKHFEARSLTNF